LRNTGASSCHAGAGSLLCVLPIRAQHGQAAVETVALLPLVAVVAALLWQAVLAGQAAWLAGSAARAAARAAAIGADPARSARGVLPERLERGLEVREVEDGVRVRVRVPAVAGRSAVGRVTATARLREQR
jgi:hypothetical protein